jgi:hypothetical protein
MFTHAKNRVAVALAVLTAVMFAMLILPVLTAIFAAVVTTFVAALLLALLATFLTALRGLAPIMRPPVMGTFFARRGGFVLAAMARGAVAAPPILALARRTRCFLCRC